MTRDAIDFAGLAAALLDRVHTLVPMWLPAGFERAGRWYCGNFDGGEGESANVNLATGQWIDNGGGEDERGGDLISLYARIRGLNNGQAARELMREMGWERPTVHAPAPAPSQASARPEPPPWDEHAASPAPAPDGEASAPAGAGPAPVVAPKRTAKWRAVTPVPKFAPPATFQWSFENKKTGQREKLEAVRTWAYTFEGELYGHVARFERTSSDGEISKETIPRTWCENLEDGRGTMAWHWKQWEAPRPLYVPAGLLSGDCSLPVVVVEGEKCAEAGHQLLGHEFDFVSWPGGCKVWSMAHWGWLMGRAVILWPDCDAQREGLTKAEREAGIDPSTKPIKPEHKQPGMVAMVGIGSKLQADLGCTVSMVQIPKPGAVGEGWDIADAISQGWDAEQVRGYLRGAATFVSPLDEARAKAVPVDGPAGASGGLDADDSLAWRGKLLTTDKGAIKAVRENIVLAIDGMRLPDGRWLPGIPEAAGVIAFNDFTNNVMKLKAAPWGAPAGEWDEVEELELGNWLSRDHWLPPMSRQTLEEAVVMVARRRRFHPARERIESLRGTWDGTKRCATWLGDCVLKTGHAGADQDTQEYLARVSTWLLMALCARVLNPGCKFDYMLILEGGQGLGKSTLARTLGLDWFADTGLVLGDKDSYQNLQGVLVYEWGELDALSRAEVTKVKQFISSQKDRFRASFDRRPKDYPRQVVFVGTTNESHYLTDPTGNRRFWPVRVSRQIDIAWLRENLNQLLAEALTYLDAGERMHPTPGEQKRLFDPQQRERAVENALESAIRRYLYDEDQRVPMNGINGSLVSEISLGDLLTTLGISVDKQTAVITKQASAALGRLGWERGRASSKGGVKVRPWVYRRPPLEEDDAGVEALADDNSPAQGSNQEKADTCPF
ncbi:MAG: hypothetical protein RJA98_2577 [Pseudomonadota bacterium]